MDDEPRRLDVRGLNCPLPALRTRKALRGLPAGGRLLVEATDPLAGLDIPHLCREDGHRLLEMTREGAVQRFLIEKAS